MINKYSFYHWADTGKSYMGTFWDIILIGYSSCVILIHVFRKFQSCFFFLHITVIMTWSKYKDIFLPEALKHVITWFYWPNQPVKKQCDRAPGIWCKTLSVSFSYCQSLLVGLRLLWANLCGPQDGQLVRWRSGAPNAALWSSVLYTFLLRVDAPWRNCELVSGWVIQKRG